jgi:hypothetical protein
MLAIYWISLGYGSEVANRLVSSARGFLGLERPAGSN